MRFSPLADDATIFIFEKIACEIAICLKIWVFGEKVERRAGSISLWNFNSTFHDADVTSKLCNFLG